MTPFRLLYRPSPYLLVSSVIGFLLKRECSGLSFELRRPESFWQKARLINHY